MMNWLKSQHLNRDDTINQSINQKRIRVTTVTMLLRDHYYSANESRIVEMKKFSIDAGTTTTVCNITRGNEADSGDIRSCKSCTSTKAVPICCTELPVTRHSLNYAVTTTDMHSSGLTDITTTDTYSSGLRDTATADTYSSGLTDTATLPPTRTRAGLTDITTTDTYSSGLTDTATLPPNRTRAA